MLTTILLFIIRVHKYEIKLRMDSTLAKYHLHGYLCNQLGDALFCVTSAERAERDPGK